MKNPCKECLVQANCTQICPEKENYKTLLDSTKHNYVNISLSNRRTESQKILYKRWGDLYKENSLDYIKIRLRQTSLNIEVDYNSSFEYDINF